MKVTPWRLAGRWKNVLVRDEPNMQPCNDVVNAGVVPHLSWSPALRGKQGLADEDVDMHLGGMRHPRRAMETITGYDRIGKAIFHTLDRCLDSQPDLQRQCLEAIGSNEATKVPNQELFGEIRRSLEALLGLEGHSREQGLDYGLLGAWGRVAGDPDTDFIEGWLREGSPAGITGPIGDPGIFPQDDAQQDDDEGQDYFHDPAGHENYDPRFLIRQKVFKIEKNRNKIDEKSEQALFDFFDFYLIFFDFYLFFFRFFSLILSGASKGRLWGPPPRNPL